MHHTTSRQISFIYKETVCLEYGNDIDMTTCDWEFQPQMGMHLSLVFHRG